MLSGVQPVLGQNFVSAFLTIALELIEILGFILFSINGLKIQRI